MADFDVVLRGGVVVDGTGTPAREADVAVRDGVVAEVGAVAGSGKQEYAIDGLIVTPGFVDIHTHYDGQMTWDNRLQPSSLHGVTTTVNGNCGVGFAPVRISDHDRLIELMEGVEDIPGVALAEGLSWEWTTFPDFLDTLDRRSYDVDVAVQVPHAALRVYTMGARAAAREIATADEIEQMAKLVAEAVRAGAVGFSTSRTLAHKTKAGEVTPSYAAGAEELVAIAHAMGTVGSGSLQMVTDWPGNIEGEFALIRAMLEASGRPMSVSLFQTAEAPEVYQRVLDFLTEINVDGHRLRAQVAARGIGILLGLQCTLHPFMHNAVWRTIAHLSPQQQAERMSSPELKAAILAAQNDERGAEAGRSVHIDAYYRMFELTDPPNYEPDPSQSLIHRAQAAGTSVESLAYDILVADGGLGMIYEPSGNFAFGNLDPVREMLAHPHTIPGLSDGGAHVGTICDASFTTTLLQHWVRDRPAGTFDLPYLVARQSRQTALAVGLSDRGLIAPGYKADLNVIDLERLQLHRPEVRYDLPAGGRRLLQRVEGYRHTFVSGVETYRDGVPTGALPGRLIRGAKTGPVGHAIAATGAR